MLKNIILCEFFKLLIFQGGCGYDKLNTNSNLNTGKGILKHRNKRKKNAINYTEQSDR